MADITVRVEASGENLAQVTAGARDGAKSGTGLTTGELVVSGAVATAERFLLPG